MKVRDLTPSERILLHRRRRAESQHDAAADYGVTLYRYRQWESGEEKPPSIALGKVLPHEVCFLRRRRAGISLKDLADRLGVCRWWLCKMEYGNANADRLVAYWSQAEKPWRPIALAASKA